MRCRGPRAAPETLLHGRPARRSCTGLCALTCKPHHILGSVSETLCGSQEFGDSLLLRLSGPAGALRVVGLWAWSVPDGLAATPGAGVRADGSSCIAEGCESLLLQGPGTDEALRLPALQLCSLFRQLLGCCVDR